jgi:hypothetical protein
VIDAVRKQRFDMRHRPVCPQAAGRPIGGEGPPVPMPPLPPPEPPATPSPTRAEVVNNLLQSVALAETALAALINTEAERLQALAATLPVAATFDDVLSLQRSVAEVLQVVVRREELLLRKLTAVLNISGGADN